MGRYYHRPLYAVDYGTVITSGSGSVLGDNNNGTGKSYQNESGSVLVYPVFNPAVIPAGREIIAVRAGHKQINGGFLGAYNGWVMTYLRIANARQSKSKVYVQDGYQDNVYREIRGTPIYNTDLQPWTAAQISSMSTDSGSAVGDIGPNTKNRWCGCVESFILVTYDEPVPIPTSPYPANNATIATSSVDFSAQHPAPQVEQPVQAIFQVARDSAFTTDVRTYIGGLNQDETATSRSYYDSVVGKSSYTDLGPGKWYLRMKGRDYRGPAHESAWGATTSFTIAHTALPVPEYTQPQAGTVSPTPYAVRAAQFVSQPSGERKVGVTWQFSQQSDFSGTVVQWTNRTGGIWTASASAPGVVTYNPEPDATVGPGLDGSKVSLEDPSQYLSQGVWYARVRATDIYGQSGAWSSDYAFTVLHAPVVANAFPQLGAAFDQNSSKVTWKFTDPWSGDSQSGYELKVFDPSSNILQDTGLVLSTVPSAPMSIPSTFLQQTLSYQLRIRDRDNVPSAWFTGTFRLSTAPIITLPYPAPDEQIISGQPEISWSVVYATGSISQKSYEVRYVRRDTGVTEFHSGVILGAATSYLPPRPILKNLTGYQLQLTITDTDNLSTTLLRNFSTNFERPDYVAGYASSDVYRAEGYVNVYYPSGVPDPFFFEWRIYRRKAGTEEWVLAGAVQDPSQLEFKDWLVAGSGDFEYSVTQAATRFGSIVESEQNQDPDSVPIYSDSYWFIVPDDEASNVQVHHVTADKYTSKRETNDYVILGGGRRRNLGTRIGKEGNLSAEIRATQVLGASEQLDVLENLNRDSRPVIMRDPFGNLTTVSLGEISVDRIAGVGNQEFADVDIPYYEVM